jgi:hypothetical protein
LDAKQFNRLPRADNFAGIESATNNGRAINSYANDNA